MHRPVLTYQQAHFLRNTILESYNRNQEVSEMAASNPARVRKNHSEHRAWRQAAAVK
ncbi:MAG: hypothetical protein ABSB41_18320 [Anaerolineales bacterium]|jgi:hypothetical protein